MPPSAVTGGGGTRRPWLAAIAAAVMMAGAVALWQWRAAPPAEMVAVTAPETRPAAVAYVANDVCGQCHEKAFAAWSKSHHDEAMILETAVGRARWCVWAGGWREATTRQADACKAERQDQTPDRACQRVRSALTHRVIVSGGARVSDDEAHQGNPSGQLRFLG